MLQRTLTIAIMTRLSSKSFNITGSETLGLAPIEDTESPYHARIPIPPLLDAQIDYLWMRRMERIQRIVLSELKSTILSSEKRQKWLSIFLTVIMLLSNLEYIYQKQHEQMRRYTGSVSVPKNR